MTAMTPSGDGTATGFWFWLSQALDSSLRQETSDWYDELDELKSPGQLGGFFLILMLEE